MILNSLATQVETSLNLTRKSSRVYLSHYRFIHINYILRNNLIFKCYRFHFLSSPRDISSFVLLRKGTILPFVLFQLGWEHLFKHISRKSFI